MDSELKGLNQVAARLYVRKSNSEPGAQCLGAFKSAWLISPAGVYSNSSNMSAISSLPLDLAGEQCPICLEPFTSLLHVGLTQRQCLHAVCTACFEDGEKAPGYTNNACPVCRVSCLASTRAGKSLIQSFPASKVTSATTAKKGGSRGPNPPRVGPSSGSAGSAGAESSEGKSERLKKRKAQEQAANEDGEDGGAFLEPRGKVRLQGIAVPVGTTRTCLPDSVWSALIALYQHLKLDLETVRRAIPELVTADPNFTRAQTFVSGYGAELVYERQINSPRDLFIRREGVYLVQLDITTADQTDKHYVTYLAATGHVIDNYPRAPVPVIEEAERQCNKKAIQVFKQLFPGAQRVFMKAVSELRRSRPNLDMAADRKSRFTCGLLFEPATTRSTPPTFDDLFVELYMDKLITQEELYEIVPTLD